MFKKPSKTEIEINKELEARFKRELSDITKKRNDEERRVSDQFKREVSLLKEKRNDRKEKKVVSKSELMIQFDEMFQIFDKRKLAEDIMNDQSSESSSEDEELKDQNQR